MTPRSTSWPSACSSRAGGPSPAAGSAPHTPSSSLPSLYLCELGGAQRLGGGERQALDAVEVPVEDARGRSIRGGHGAHEPHFACEPIRWGCQRAGGGEIGEVLGGETRLAVELACAGGDPLERPLQALAGWGACACRQLLGRSCWPLRFAGGLIAGSRIGASSETVARAAAASGGSSARVFWQPARLRSGPEGVVHQDRAAVGELGARVGEHRLRLIAAPVVGVDRPAHELQPEPARRHDGSRRCRCPTAPATAAGAPRRSPAPRAPTRCRAVALLR